MKYTIYIISLVCWISACNSQKSKDRNVEDQHAEERTDGKALALPMMGAFDLAKMKAGRLNEYGAGDCGGSIREYSSQNITLVIDSMTCSEQGYTYTFCRLNSKDSIEMIFVKKSSSLHDFDNNRSFFVQEEQIIDFMLQPATLMSRVDTVYDYDARQNEVNKKFISSPLANNKNIYKELKGSLEDKWLMKIEDY